MTYKKVTLEKKNEIAKITLNRPEVLNAMDAELLSELASACDDIEEDDSVKVAILTGAGRAFSAGMDLRQIRERRGRRGGPRPRGYQVIEELSKPVIAAVNGYCFTGAFELVMHADIIIASENAIFCDTHARFGILPGGGQTQRLTREIGPKKAKELMFTCDRIPADEAERIGIVNKVVPLEKLEEAAVEMAEKILDNIPESIRTIKWMVNEGMKTDLESGLKLEKSQQGGPWILSEESQKRITDRFEKR